MEFVYIAQTIKNIYKKIQTYAKKDLLFQKQSGIIQLSKNLMRKR